LNYWQYDKIPPKVQRNRGRRGREETMTTGIWEPTLKQASSLKQFSRNGEHYLRNLRQIKGKHAGRFVAILNEEVFLDSDKIDDLFAKLKQRLSEQELHKVYLVYVPNKDEVRIA
jgi:hypothetical protein